MSNWENGFACPTWAQWLQLKALLNFSSEMDAEVWRLNGRKGQPGETWYEREVIGQHPNPASSIYGGGSLPTDVNLTAPATPLAKIWEGHRYGGQLLKNSLEPIIVFQKPYDGKPVQSIVTHGAGALNIEASRISGKRWAGNFALSHLLWCEPIGTQRVKGSHLDHVCGRRSTDDYGMGLKHCQGYTDADGYETVQAWNCAPECPVFLLDQQAGIRSSGGINNPIGYAEKGSWRLNEGRIDPRSRASAYAREASTGNASRFFHVSSWQDEIAEQLAQANPVFYAAKASRRERDSGLDQRNPHPTIKPLALCRWLTSLLLPPDAYAPRRLLVPFAGASSEMIGAMQVGWEEIVGIELEAESVAIAQQRLAYWASQRKD